MQLRAARLCLNCEELHTDNSCPRCASDAYAFLSTWLPVEERRRWKRAAAEPDHPMTRASDHVVDLSFDDEKNKKAKPRRRSRWHPQPSKNPAR